MKTYLLFLFLCVLTTTLYGQLDCSCTEVDEQAAIYKVVERMPLFPGCYESLSYPEQKRCADTRMLDFIYSNLRYPDIAVMNRTEGMAVVSFLIEPDGCISSIKLLRSVADDCGKEAKRLVELMKAKGIKWVPGYHDGELVRVQFNLPIKFRISPDANVQDSRFMDYDVDCEVEPVDIKAYGKLNPDFDFFEEEFAPNTYSLNVNADNNFDARIEIISMELGNVEFILERPFSGLNDVYTMDLSHLSPGEKTLLITSKGGLIELASFDFSLN